MVNDRLEAMKGIITFLIIWLVAYVFYAGIVYFTLIFFDDNKVLLVSIIITGFIVTQFILLRVAFGLLNRWLER